MISRWSNLASRFTSSRTSGIRESSSEHSIHEAIKPHKGFGPGGREQDFKTQHGKSMFLFNKFRAEYSQSGAVAMNVAVLDIETAGLGSVHSNFSEILTDGEMRSMAKKMGMRPSQIRDALSYKSSPIWEVGLLLPGEKVGKTRSIVNPIKGRLEKGAEDLLAKADISKSLLTDKNAGAKLRDLFNEAQRGEIAKDTLLNKFDAMLMSSEKATLEYTLTRMKNANTTHIAGWNIKGFDFQNIVMRSEELGVSPSLVEWARQLNVIDVLDDAEDLIQVMMSPYDDVLGQVTDPTTGRGTMPRPRYRKGLTKLSSVAELFPAAGHVAHRAGTKAGDTATTEYIRQQMMHLHRGDKEGMRNVLKGMNQNIERWYAAAVDEMEVGGLDVAYQRNLLKGQLKTIQSDVDAILDAKRVGPLTEHQIQMQLKLEGSLSQLHAQDPRNFPTGAQVLEQKAAEVVERKQSRLWKEVTEEIGDMSSRATRKVYDVMRDGLPKLQGMWDDLSKHISPKHMAGLALIGGVALAYKGFRGATEGDKYEGDFIDAGMLGMTESSLRQAIMKAKEIEGFNKDIQHRNKRVGKWNAMSAGREVHEMIQRESGKMSEFAGVEVPVKDTELGIKGMIDLVVRQEGENIPIEIKTVETVDDLMALERPKDAHMSQANFYSHALGSQGAYIMYAAREDPSKRKTFYQPYSAGQLVGDVHKFRSTLTQAVKSDPSVQYYWRKHIEDMGWNMPVPSGIRPNARQGYGGRDSMKGNGMFGFPGGREQTFSGDSKVSFSGGRSRSKIRDQASRNRFSGMGHQKTPIGGNFTANPASRQLGSS